MLSRALIFYLACSFSAQASIEPTAQLPTLGNSASSYVSLQQEYELGRLWLRQLRAQTNVSSDPVAIEFLENLIYRMVPNSEVQISNFEFVIVDSKELNAFAVPGGIIGINYGLFLYTRDEDEMSGVLGHELAHLSQRHFARQIEQAEKQSPIALATLLASILLIATNNANLGMAGLIGSQAASIQKQLAYSREWEREADRLGIKTLANSGLDPNAMASMFQQMLYASRYSQRPPEFLLTHPMTESRVAEAQDRAEQYPAQKRTQSFEFLILQNSAQIYYQLQGEQAKQYFKQQVEKAAPNSVQQAAALYSLATLALGNQDAAQALNYLQEIPSAWRKHNASVALEALCLQAVHKGKEALALIDAALPFAPQSLTLLSTQAKIQQNQGKHAEAMQIWRKLSELRPSEPSIWKELSTSAANAKQLVLAYRANAEFLFYNGQQPQALRQMELAIKEARQQGDFQQESALKQRQLTMAQAPSKF